MRRTLGAFALLSLGLTVSGRAQAPARLEGTVTDAVTGRPVPSAEVTAGDEHRLAREDGSFLFGSTVPGRIMVRVRAPGYAGVLRVVEVLPGLTVRMDLVLQPVAVQLDTVTVIAEPETGPSIPGRLLQRRAADLAEALNGWGGIMIRRGGAGDEAVAQVRGSAPDEVLVLLDGFPLNNPLTGRADLRGIATRDIERVTLFRGGQTARYGSRAIAAVIVISTKTAHRPELGGSVSSRGGVRGRLAIAAEGVSLALMGEHTPDGFRYAAPLGGEADRVNAGGEFYTLNARGGSPGIWSSAAGGQTGGSRERRSIHRHPRAPGTARSWPDSARAIAGFCRHPPSGSKLGPRTTPRLRDFSSTTATRRASVGPSRWAAACRSPASVGRGRRKRLSGGVRTGSRGMP